MVSFLRILIILSYLAVAVAEPTVKTLNISFDDLNVVNDESPEEGVEIGGGVVDKQTTSSDAALNDKIEANASVERQNNTLDSFFDRSLKILERIKTEGGKVVDSTKKLVLSEQKPQVKINRQNPATSFPDPLFYDAIYTKNDKFITYAYVYNNKTNRDNNHIPRLIDYDTMAELFLLSKDRSNVGKFQDLFGVTRTERNFNINKPDKFGNTLLLTSLRNANLDLFRFLLSNNANPNVCNNSGVCPIHLAVYSGNATLVGLLCDVNTDIKIKDKNGVDLIHYVIYNKQTALFHIMFKRYLRYPVNVKERQDLIRFAANLGREAELKEMKRAFHI